MTSVPTVVLEVLPAVVTAWLLEVYVATGLVLESVPTVVVLALGSVPTVALDVFPSWSLGKAALLDLLGLFNGLILLPPHGAVPVRQGQAAKPNFVFCACAVGR